MPRIYLDHNAMSPMPAEVVRALADAAARLRGNASSPHAEGQGARALLDEAREEVARLVGAGEVVFTSGGTESNNLALRGLASAARRRRGEVRIVTSAVEHPSVLEACLALERDGAEVERLPVDACGLVDPSELEASLRRRRADVVSVMHANNETGVIQPVEDLAAVARGHGAIFHTDMAQSAGKVPISRAASAVSALTLAPHKLGGPPGIGVLMVEKGTEIESQIAGGNQEEGRRAGTEPVFLAAGLAAALRLVDLERAEGLAVLRDRIEAALPSLPGGARIHGAGAPRVPNTTSFFLPGLPGRHLVVQLDLMGIAISTGSACSTGTARPSHVLLAMGCTKEESSESVRVSLGPSTSEEEVEALLGALEDLVSRSASRGAGSAARLAALERSA